MKQLYWRFYKAARKRDAGTLVHLIQSHPELHYYQGQAGMPLGTLVHHAPELLEAAFEAGLSPNAEPEDTPETLLQHAAANGDLGRIRLLIRYGADLEKRNDVGEVALGYACSWGQLEAARILVEAGANVNAVEEDPTTSYRNTPLDCTLKYPEIAAYLRSKGAKHLEELENDPGREP